MASKKTQQAINSLEELTSKPYPIDEQDLDNMPLRLLYSRFLMASYLYYKLDEESLWSDYQYDKVCRRLHKEWNDFEHMHKYLVRQDDLESGTAYFISDYPSIVKCCAHKWVNQEWG